MSVISLNKKFMSKINLLWKWWKQFITNDYYLNGLNILKLIDTPGVRLRPVITNLTKSEIYIILKIKIKVKDVHILYKM